MVDHEDTKTWTKKYVLKNRKECLFLLQETNLLIVRYLAEENYTAAAVCAESVLNGLIPMSNTKEFGELRPHLSMLSFISGELLLFTDSAKLNQEMHSVGIRTTKSVSQLGGTARELALLLFEDARDFAQSSEMREYVSAIISAMQSGRPAEQIQRQYAPDYPEDLREVLLDIDLQFFMPQINRCVSAELASSSRSRPAKPKPARTSSPPPVSRPSAPSGGGWGRSKKKPANFDEWMEMNGWGEEELAWAYQRVKLRRNIYGVLSFVPVLGILMFPFWLRAIFLTKAMYHRDIHVDFNLPIKILIVMYGLPSFFIYPIVMGWIISWTNWGMGLRDPKGRVLNVLFWGAIILLLLYSMVGGGVFDGLAEGLSSIPGKVTSIFVQNRSAKAPGQSDPGAVTHQDTGLVGNWYNVTLHTPEDSLEPNLLTLNYYSFREDGTCDFLWQRYYRDGSPRNDSLSAFQASWQPEYDDLSLQTYAVDEQEMLLSVCVEGAPPDSFFSNSEYDTLYTFEFHSGMLILGFEDQQTVYRRTALGREDAGRLITGLSAQSAQLSGRWTTAWREENSIWMSTFTFEEDGSFINSPMGYDHVSYAPMEGERGWYVMPMGHPASYGTYTFDGQNLVLTYLACDVIAPDAWTDWSEVIPVGGDLSNTLELDGTLYIPDDNTKELTELWSMIGVDYSAS